MNKPFFYLSYTEDERKVFSFSKESIDKKFLYMLSALETDSCV